jgi:hypothetical protein
MISSAPQSNLEAWVSPNDRSRALSAVRASFSDGGASSLASLAVVTSDLPDVAAALSLTSGSQNYTFSVNWGVIPGVTEVFVRLSIYLQIELVRSAFSASATFNYTTTNVSGNTVRQSSAVGAVTIYPYQATLGVVQLASGESLLEVKAPNTGSIVLTLQVTRPTISTIASSATIVGRVARADVSPAIS